MKLINEADYLETNNGRFKCVTIRLSKETIETMSKFKNKIQEDTKDLKAVIKIWRKRLGDDRRQKFELEKQLGQLESTIVKLLRTGQHAQDV